MTRSLLGLLAVATLAGCTGFRTYTRATPVPLADAFACAAAQMEQLGYSVEIRDSIGGFLQGQREITGITESARRGAAAATEVLTIGLAGGKRRRYDQITVLVYSRPYPEGNAIDATAGLLTVTEGNFEQSPPTDVARRNARQLVNLCAAS